MADITDLIEQAKKYPPTVYYLVSKKKSKDTTTK